MRPQQLTHKPTKIRIKAAFAATPIIQQLRHSLCVERFSLLCIPLRSAMLLLCIIFATRERRTHALQCATSAYWCAIFAQPQWHIWVDGAVRSRMSSPTDVDYRLRCVKCMCTRVKYAREHVVVVGLGSTSVHYIYYSSTITYHGRIERSRTIINPNALHRALDFYTRANVFFRYDVCVV